MKRCQIGILAVVSLIILSGVRIASAQTSYGNTGLFVHPTARVSAEKGFRLNISYLNVLPSDSNAESHWVPVNLSYRLDDRAEIGATYVERVIHRTSFSSGGAFGKYLLVTETQNRPAVAVVGNFLLGDLKLYSLSLAVSKEFKQASRSLVTLHAGWQYAHWKDDDSDSGDSRPYVGASVPVIPHFSLIGEWGKRLSFDESATKSLGIQYSDGHGLNIGTGFVNDGRNRRGGFFFGIGRPIAGD